MRIQQIPSLPEPIGLVMRTSSFESCRETPMNLKRYLLVASLVLSTLFTPMVHAQSDSQSDALFKTIQALDTKLFDALYNWPNRLGFT
jgi:hypothetical protein